MSSRGLIAGFLFVIILSFVLVLGYGAVTRWMDERKASLIRSHLEESRVSYITGNPDDFLYVDFYYDPTGRYRSVWFDFLEGVNMKGKIYVRVYDTRGVFSNKTGTVLLDQFKKELEVIYPFIESVALDMDTDIVAKFHTKEEIPLGYFYQGEYHLWEK